LKLTFSFWLVCSESAISANGNIYFYWSYSTVYCIQTLTITQNECGLCVGSGSSRKISIIMFLTSPFPLIHSYWLLKVSDLTPGISLIGCKVSYLTPNSSLIGCKVSDLTPSCSLIGWEVWDLTPTPSLIGGIDLISH